MRFGRVAIIAVLASLATGAAADQATNTPPQRQSLDDAWWTGPLLAANAGSLPPGHLLFEPYFFDSIPYEHVDSQGIAHAVAQENNFGSFSYLLYGLADGFTVGLIPRFGFEQSDHGRSSAAIAMGDWTVQGQYQLTQFQEGDWLPTISLNVGETIPTGHYDRLDRYSDGLGDGAYTTILSAYLQTYFWMPNGRILRTRLNLSYAISRGVGLRDMSVYGTTQGFLGRASPGASATGDLAFEYSIDRNWVAAMDFWLEQDGNTHVAGTYPSSRGGSLTAMSSDSGVGQSLYLAPALEYNWSSTLGIILGARVFAAGRNETALVTPVLAIDYVH